MWQQSVECQIELPTLIQNIELLQFVSKIKFDSDSRPEMQLCAFWTFNCFAKTDIIKGEGVTLGSCCYCLSADKGRQSSNTDSRKQEKSDSRNCKGKQEDRVPVPGERDDTSVM